MRTSLLLVAAILVSSTSCKAQTGSDSSATESIQKQIEANEQAIGRAIRSHDYLTVEKFWSPQMVVNAPANKISSREQVLASMKDGSGLNYSSLKGTTESFTVYGNIAIEMGHEDFVMAAGPAAGKPLQRRFTNVWQRSVVTYGSK